MHSNNIIILKLLKPKNPLLSFKKIWLLNCFRFSLFKIPPNSLKKLLKNRFFENCQDENNFKKILSSIKDEKYFTSLHTDLYGSILEIKEDEKSKYCSLIFITILLYAKSSDRKFIEVISKLQKKLFGFLIPLETKVKKTFISNNQDKQINKETFEELDLYISIMFAKVIILQKNIFKSLISNNDVDKLLNFYLISCSPIDSNSKEKELKKLLLLKILVFYLVTAETLSIESSEFRDNHKLFINVAQHIVLKLGLFEFFKETLIHEFKTNQIKIAEFTQIISLHFELFFCLLEDTKYWNDFLNLLADLSSSIDFSLILSIQILEYFEKILRQKKNFPNQKNLELIFNYNFEILLKSFEIILGNLDKISVGTLIKILIVASMENMIRYYHEFFLEFFEKTVLFLEKKTNQMNLAQKINFFYAIGKSGFLSENLKKIICDEFNNFDFHKENIWLYLKLLKVVVNLRIIKRNSPSIPSIGIFFSRIEQLPISEKIEVYSNLSILLLRIFYGDPKFWKKYFENVVSLINDKKIQKFSTFSLLKAFPLVFSEKNTNLLIDKENLDEIKIIYASSIQKEEVKNFLSSSLSLHSKEIPNEKKTLGSLLENKIHIALKKLGVTFIEQAQS